ncbi:hypothetical protein ACFX12_025616 [Malus domestica]
MGSFSALIAIHRGLSVHISFVRSTNLDSWTPKQLRTMSFGGNNCAQVLFKQHGWTDGGKIEARYTSRAAELYRQILSIEEVKSVAEEAGLPPSPVVSQSGQTSNVIVYVKTWEAPKENSIARKEMPEITHSKKAFHTYVTSTVKKPLGGAKKIGKTGGLGACKLTTKPNESLYDQKPENPVVPVPLHSPTNSTPTVGSSFASRFEFWNGQ